MCTRLEGGKQVIFVKYSAKSYSGPNRERGKSRTPGRRRESKRKTVPPLATLNTTQDSYTIGHRPKYMKYVAAYTQVEYSAKAVYTLRRLSRLKSSERRYAYASRITLLYPVPLASSTSANACCCSVWNALDENGSRCAALAGSPVRSSADWLAQRVSVRLRSSVLPLATLSSLMYPPAAC